MGIPNNAHASRWEAVLSNIPTIGDTVISQDLYNLYIKGVTIPDTSINMINSDFRDYTYLTPGTRGNTEYFQLLIEFAVSEDMSNYYNFLQLMQMTRFEESSKEQRLKDLNINKISVFFKDNQKRKTSVMDFKNCFLTNLSSLSLIYGSREEIIFTATFTYQEVLLIK
jgi:hypothetical protein